MATYQSELHGFLDDFLPAEDVARLLQMMECIQLETSQVLFDSGQDADGMYFVISGRVAVQKETGFGGRKQVVALLDSGAPVGECGLLAGVQHGASVVAVRESSLLYLSKSAFDLMCEERSDFGLIFFRWLMQRVSMRLRANTERLAHVL